MAPDDVLEMLIEGLPGLAAVYLFGSQAQGRARPDSDIDLAVLGAHGPWAVEPVMALREALEAKLGRDVDLIDLGRASTVLAREATVGGRRLAAPDARAADAFESATMQDWFDLRIRRLGLDADIRDRGRVRA